MSSTGEAEVKVLAEDVPPAPVEVPAAEEPKDAEPVKEKKPRTPREKKPRQPKVASHPPYFQMIKEAIASLNEKNGSSPYAIAKYMEEKHKEVLPANFRKILALQLKNSTAKGKLMKIMASYKLSEAGKKENNASKVAKANAEKKTKQTRTTRTTASKRKAVKKDETASKAAKAVKKVVAKKPRKSTPAKPKQPKSIRPPAAKRAKKAVA